MAGRHQASRESEEAEFKEGWQKGKKEARGRVRKQRANVDKRKKASEKVGRLQRAQQINQPSRHRRVRASTIAKKCEKDKGE